MQDLPFSYVAELHRQTAFISAVLGGFAVAFLSGLLAVAADRKSGTWAIGFAAFSAVLFVVATVASTVVVLDALSGGVTTFNFEEWQSSTIRAKTISDLAFFAGMYLLLIAIGLSGWARSKATGVVTTAAAGLGVLLLSIIVVGVL